MKKLLPLVAIALASGCSATQVNVKPTNEVKLAKAQSTLEALTKPVADNGKVWMKEGNTMITDNHHVVFYREQDYQPVIEPTVQARNAAIDVFSSNTHRYKWARVVAFTEESCSKTFDVGSTVKRVNFRINNERVLVNMSCDLNDAKKLKIDFAKYDQVEKLLNAINAGLVVLPELGVSFDTSKLEDAKRAAYALNTVNKLSH